MNVALCLSGQPRNVELGFPYIESNVLHTCNPDVFIHTWKPDADVVLNAGGHVASESIPENVEEILRDLYRPISLHMEDSQVFDERNYNEHKYPGIQPSFSLSQRYSIKQSNALKSWHEQEHMGQCYDAVIRMRFDWAIKTPINLELFDLSGINVTDDCPHPDSINDQFAVSSSKNMNWYAALYDHIPKYYDAGVIFCDEILLSHHLREANISAFRHKINYGLIRGKHLTEWGRTF